MTAKFILSFDCEGKWGVADHLGRLENEALTDDRLTASYRSLLSSLGEYQILATFAFVGLFAIGEKHFGRLDSLINRAAELSPYLRAALAAMADGNREGWHGHWAVQEVVNASQPHEIALHGVTHIPWPTMGRQLLQTELQLHSVLEGPVSRAKTFVYPRNQVAHVNRLLDFGLQGFRDAVPRRSRLRSLASELNILANPAIPGPAETLPVAIPAGFFVNWRMGPRRFVPMSVSVARLRRLLSRAKDLDGIVHFWMHPENIATAPETLELARRMLRVVADAAMSGDCEILTQADYVQQHRPRTALEAQ